ncbi:MAG: TIGR00296 family protein [Candidatus Micrarchaeota archaeon]|nr:TIGR00296 family protein [Candidatus Micrarchaeota archaeon]
MKAYSLEEGTRLVKAARHAVELYITTKEFRSEAVERTLQGFTQKHGVFVTIYHYPTRTLRGCIGFPEGIGEIKKLIVEAAVAAAAEDPRFVPVSHLEFEHTVLEISVLSKLEKVEGSAEQIKKQVKVGRDGLVIEYGYHKGLLLPIVPVEEHWSVPRFLDEVCIKAGLPEHTWTHGTASLYKFSSQVFREKEPRGDVEEANLEEL